MKVLIIDNHDSFTYNLKHYVQQFYEDVDVLRASDINIESISEYNKVILSPGPGLPEDHPILNQVLVKYYQNKSILGICLGQQSIAEFFGATLYNLSEVKHGVSSEIIHYNNSKVFNDLPSNFKVGHYHSWAVSKENFPNVLIVTSENIEGKIMSIKHKEFDITGLQFHPESILTENGLKMIENWLTN
ncbi:MAG: aminodeoxychorismate/anthranilate synthase component II [Flavobacteriales bacterium]|nr:aminodeoxychorismate/anthranilate synthase component II [Flavobacteriales bacterium]